MMQPAKSTHTYQRPATTSHIHPHLPTPIHNQPHPPTPTHIITTHKYTHSQNWNTWPSSPKCYILHNTLNPFGIHTQLNSSTPTSVLPQPKFPPPTKISHSNPAQVFTTSQNSSQLPTPNQKISVPPKRKVVNSKFWFSGQNFVLF